MIVWGGSMGSTFNTGGRYDPVTDSWTATNTTNAPSARASHTAIWAGHEMIIWGGTNLGSDLNTGGRYCAQGGPIANPNPYICANCNSNCITYTYPDAYAYAHAHAHAMHRKMSTDAEAAPNSRVTAYSASSHNTRATSIFSATYSGATSLAARMKSCNRDCT